MKTKYLLAFLIGIGLYACKSNDMQAVDVTPVFVTETTPNDTDDPAIWYNAANPENTLILGTDKGDSTGGIFVFDLKGKLIDSLCLKNLHRPNNIDVEYGFTYNDSIIDIAVFTERGKNKIRVISLPNCKFIDNGGISVFVDDNKYKDPMGIALYKDKSSNVFAFVSRKTGPEQGYIYQYQLIDSSKTVIANKVRAFGNFSGKKEIEAIVVDDDLGYVYYSDENMGVRKYYADADKGNTELALFATQGVKSDHEGLSIYKSDKDKGFIILSDQQANKFRLFPREGTADNPHQHNLVRIVATATNESDGSEILNMPLNNNFPKGIFVAMSNNKTFHYYRAEDIVGK